MYHNESERSWLDWLMVIVVFLLAVVVISLSFQNTVRLANQLGLSPRLTTGLVEILFASLLFLRGRQRATQRNVPQFLEIGYFVSFLFVTGVNVWGLWQKHPIVGPIVGIAISGAMWLMESTLVWLWTDSMRPYEKTLRDLKRETKREIKEIKEIQRLEWMKYEARKPDLDLIKDARRTEEKRKKVIGDGLPEFFIELQKKDPIKQLAVELEKSRPKVIDVQEEQETEQTAEVIPIKRQIGFHAEPIPVAKPAPAFQPNMEKRKQAIEKARALRDELGRIPKKSELMKQGLTEHYSKYAIEMLKKETE